MFTVRTLACCLSNSGNKYVMIKVAEGRCCRRLPLGQLHPAGLAGWDFTAMRSLLHLAVKPCGIGTGISTAVLRRTTCCC